MEENIVAQQENLQPQSPTGQATNIANAIEPIKRSHHKLMVFILIASLIIFSAVIYYIYTINTSVAIVETVKQPVVVSEPVTIRPPSPTLAPESSETTDEVNVVDVDLDLSDLNKDVQGL